MHVHVYTLAFADAAAVSSPRISILVSHRNGLCSIRLLV